MEYTISLASVVGLAVIMLIGVLLSLGLFAVLRFRFKPNASAFFAGTLMTFVAGFMLTQICNICVLSGSLGETIESNIWLYSLYIGISAALVEETCRLWTYRGLLRKQLTNDYNALMFGAGQGGGEAIWMLTIQMAANYLVAVTIYQGNSAYLFQDLTSEEWDLTVLVLDQLTQKPAIDIFMMGVERIGYSVMHIALAVVVFFAANKKYTDWRFYWIALGIRFGFQFLVTLVPLLGANSVISALTTCVCGAACAVAAWKIWMQEHVPVLIEAEPEPEDSDDEEEEEY